ncbi:MAG: ATP-binding protein [Pseudomonadota bacterium]
MNIVNLRFLSVYLPGLLLLGYLIIGAVELMIVRQLDRELIDLSVDRARQVSDISHDIVQTYHARWLRGDLGVTEARELAFEEIQALEFGGSGHFFVFNLNGVVLVNGADPDLVGQNLYGLTDAHGKSVIKQLLREAFSDGESTVFSATSNVEGAEVMPANLDAIYFAKRFSPWSIVVGTRIDGAEIKAAHTVLLRDEMWQFALIILIMTPIFWYLRRAALGLVRELETNNAQLLERERELTDSLAFFKAVTQHAPDPIVLVNRDGTIRFSSRAVNSVFELGDAELVGTPFSTLFVEDVQLDALLDSAEGKELKGRRGDRPFSLRLAVSEVVLADGARMYTVIMQDLTPFKRLESELLQAQKLESVGQLAAGIAHEINTPAQFIGDNLQFVDEAAGDLLAAVESIKFRVANTEDTSLRDDVHSALNAADIDFVMQELPRALSESLDGINRVAHIVQAMKHYAHPGESMQRVDINVNIEKTITVSKGEWKYHAEMVTDFGSDMPMVECIPSDINQVVLNLVVNAGHTIAERREQSPDHQGRISVSTRTLDDHVHIYIEDNGMGMGEHTIQRMFDPFFTTKAQGKGTGQGLSIARKIITAHGGTIAVDSEVGSGTIFTIRLPALASANLDSDRAA